MNEETSLSEEYQKGYADGKLGANLIWVEKVVRLKKEMKTNLHVSHKDNYADALLQTIFAIEKIIDKI